MLDLAVTAILSLALWAVSISNGRRILRAEAALLVVIYVSYVTWRTGFA
jgi:hypothetical protein